MVGQVDASLDDVGERGAGPLAAPHEALGEGDVPPLELRRRPPARPAAAVDELGDDGDVGPDGAERAAPVRLRARAVGGDEDRDAARRGERREDRAIQLLGPRREAPVGQRAAEEDGDERPAVAAPARGHVGDRRPTPRGGDERAGQDDARPIK